MQEDNKTVEIETFEELKQLKLAIIAEVQQHVQPSDWKEGSDKMRELRKRWAELSANAKAIVIEEEDNKLNEKFDKTCETFYQNREQHYAAIEQEKANNAKRKHALIDELKQILHEGKAIESMQRVKKIQEEFREIGPTPVGETESLHKSFQALLDQIYAEVKIYYELKDIDRKKNYEEKTHLCEQAESLLNEPDIRVAHQRMRTLYSTWKEIGHVPLEYADAIWERFKKAMDAIHARYDEHLESLKKEYEENLTKKQALCEELQKFVENLNVENKSTNWKECLTKIKSFEQQWEHIGYVPKEQSDEVWKKYRSAINQFYVKQKEFFKLRHQEKENAIQQKMALIEAVEALKDSTDWEKTTEALKKYQEDWRNTGYLNEKDGKALWERFRSACDYFFNQRKNFYDQLEQERVKNLEEKERICTEIESFVEQEPNEEHTNKVKEYQKLWKTLGEVPIKYKEKIWNRFVEACDAYFDHLRSFNKKGSTKNKRHHHNHHQENEQNEHSNEAQINKKLKALAQEKEQLENNLSFFAKGKSGNSLRDRVQEQIDKINQQIDTLKAQLKAIKTAKRQAEEEKPNIDDTPNEVKEETKID